MTFYIVVLVVALVVLWAVTVYNSLVRRKNVVKEAWSGIDVQLKRRADLIPNLVETVKGYATHERGPFDELTRLRAQTGTQDIAERAQTEAAITAAIGKVMAVAEAYPDLKASQNMQQLSEELTSTENKVAFARQAYNDSVLKYNNQRETFPTSVLAGSFHFDQAALWEIAPDHPETREAPKVQF